MWRLNEIRGNVQLSSWYTVGAKYSLPNSGSGRDGQHLSDSFCARQSIFFSNSPRNGEMQLHTDVPTTPSDSGNMCLVYSQSPQPQDRDTGLSFRELHRQHGRPCPPLSTLKE